MAGTTQIIIDEIQKLPALLPAIKRAVDTCKGGLHSVSFADAEGLRLFMKEHPKAASGAVIYRGKDVCRLVERIIALPLNLVLGVRFAQTH